MAVSARIVVLAGLTLLFAAEADAQQAASQQPCEGTLCDLYYGGRGPAPTPATAPATTPGLPPGATPLLAPTNPLSRLFGGGSSSSSGTPSDRLPVPPSEPATSNNSYMHLNGGGLLGSGGQRCEGGTLCDLIGSSSPAQPTDVGQRQAAAGNAGTVPVEPPVVHRHILHESETRPKCSSPNADPWRCYR